MTERPSDRTPLTNLQGTNVTGHSRVRGLMQVSCVILLLAASPQGTALRSQSRFNPPVMLHDPVLPDTSASLPRYIATHIDEFATPEFYERKRERRKFQRDGYTDILQEVLGLDAVGALFSFIRTRLRIEYALLHNTIYYRTVNGGLMALPEDWTFPVDPWAD